jgi:hypothetical protein
LYSNLESKIWNLDGRKVGYIAVIHVSAGQREIPMEKEFIGDTYRTNEEISSVRNIRFEFRDKWGDYVTFTKPYHLELAIFFK